MLTGAEARLGYLLLNSPEPVSVKDARHLIQPPMDPWTVRELEHTATVLEVDLACGERTRWWKFWR